MSTRKSFVKLPHLIGVPAFQSHVNQQLSQGGGLLSVVENEANYFDGKSPRLNELCDNQVNCSILESWDSASVSEDEDLADEHPFNIRSVGFADAGSSCM